MSWHLAVYDPLGTTLLANYKDVEDLIITPNASGDVTIFNDPAPKARLEPPGRLVDLTFYGTRDGLSAIVPRSIVQWTEDNGDGVATAYGVITNLPSANTVGSGPKDKSKGDLEKFVAEGLELLTKGIIIDTPYYDSFEPVYDAAYEIASRYKHAAYFTTAGNFTGTPADTVRDVGAPEQNVYDYLDFLASQYAGYRWYIRGTDGQMIFEKV